MPGSTHKLQKNNTTSIYSDSHSSNSNDDDLPLTQRNKIRKRITVKSRQTRNCSFKGISLRSRSIQ